MLLSNIAEMYVACSYPRDPVATLKYRNDALLAINY
jgi:hypothetical protein